MPAVCGSNSRQPRSIDQLALHAVGLTPLEDSLQRRQFGFTRRNNHLAANLVRDSLGGTELLHCQFASPAIQRPQGARPVVNARVEHAGVSAGLMHRQLRLFFQNA